MIGPIPLTAVDRLEVTILVDNTVDMLLPSSNTVQRARISSETFERPPLLAEHGYALLITVCKDGHTQSILYDAGLGKETLVHNMDALEIKPDGLHAIVLSHGHSDHHGGLMRLLKRLGKKHIPLVLHPDVWRDRKGVFPGGGELHLSPPSRADLEQEGVEVVEHREPTLLLDNVILVTGQVARTTDFEKGMPRHMAYNGHEWEEDTWIWDDQAVIINVRNQGLVVLSGCSHAGIVNVLRYGQQLTGIQKIHGVIGGFHLSGVAFEKIIPLTVNALREIGPDVICPGHCSGWKAIHEIARQMPQAYVQTCVGTTFHFG